MTLYLGGKPVCPARVVEKKVAKTKFGASIDTFIGDVDADGNYIALTEPVEVNLAGVKSVPENGFSYTFSGFRQLTVSANDVTYVGDYGFQYAFSLPNSVKTDSLNISFDGLEVVESAYAFQYACQNRSSSYNNAHITFAKLKKVNATNVFNLFAALVDFELFDKIFPLLEEVGGNSVFNGAFSAKPNKINPFSRIKKITGGSYTYTGTFTGFYTKNTVWHFPRATEFSGYIWNFSTSYPGEIHFAAANQAAIEASDKYSEKWGFAAAEIYFDLMLTITVNGVNYERKHTIGGYTSWVSENGDIIYTDATAEPAAGTVVYSDQGTTQVGTVTEAA